MTATFYVGDALKVLATLPQNSVDLVLTSPPFLALRSYLPSDHPDKALEGGSQPTPGAYIDWLLDVVEACDRVLAPHGSICVELGDTYAGSGGAGGDYGPDGLREGQPKFRQVPQYRVFDKRGVLYDDATPPQVTPANGGYGWPLPKSLSLIPESFRFAMVYGFNPFTGKQTERWRLRNVIRWVRPNPPVGALGDKFRPATSELMVFCKSAKRYFDLDAVREPPTAKPQRFLSQSDVRSVAGPKDKRGRGELSSFVSDEVTSRANPAGAPPLDWWNIPPGGYSGAHYAVWPEELLIKPIKAMCPEQVCGTCGEARRRIVDVSYVSLEDPVKNNAEPRVLADVGNMRQRGDYDPNPAGMRMGRASKTVNTLGFTNCEHDDYRPGLVLDPFVGSGTTLAVATGHGRDAIGIDLDERNYDLALERVGPLVLQRGEVAA